jgi:hypothetical protein
MRDKKTAMARMMAPVIAAAAAAVMLAPSASATSNGITCREGGAARVCQKSGHASLHTSPTVREPAGGLLGSAWLPGYGRGHLPPMIAMD